MRSSQQCWMIIPTCVRILPEPLEHLRRPEDRHQASPQICARKVMVLGWGNPENSRIHDFPTISWMFNPSALPPNLGFSTQHIWSHPPGAHLQQVYRTWQVVVASAQHQRTTPLAVHHRHLSVLQEAPGCGWSWERLACRVKSTLVTPCMVLYIQKPSKTWILLNLHPLQIRHFWGHPNPPTSPTSASDPPAAPPPPHRTALAPGARRRTRRRTRRRRRSAGAVPEGRAVDVPAATSPATWSWMGGLDITKKAKKLVMGWVWSLDFSYFGWRGWGFRFFETLLGGGDVDLKKWEGVFKKGVDEDSGFFQSIDLSWCWNHPSNINIDLLWLVVNLPLWKILVSWDYYSQYMEK